VMPLVAKNRAVLYRQRAQECLDLARTLTFGTERQVLIDMAQTWLELAEEQEAECPPVAISRSCSSNSRPNPKTTTRRNRRCSRSRAEANRSPRALKIAS
jgi:hypothetical protein